MALDWQKLTELTQGKRIEIEKVRLTESSIALEGPFELPPLAALTLEDQVFVIAFVRTHGSIKEMEQLFGVSYPTIKNRLQRIAEQFEYVEIRKEAVSAPSLTEQRKQILEDLENKKLDAKQAMAALKELKE
jgi:hypothetical protein